MSSSNRVRVVSITETVYGETPAAGNFDSARFVSESLSGTPDTAESQLIREDRMSSGQIVVGLTVGGELTTELAKDSTLEEWFESAMYSTWVTTAPVVIDLSLDVSAKTLTRSGGDWNGQVRKGDIVILTGFTNTINNNEVMVANIVSATVIDVIVPDTMVTEVSSGNSFEVADYLEIGVTKKSFSMEKAFLDLTDKAINYRGMIVASMTLNATWGEIVSASFTFSGNDHEPVEAAAGFITDSRTINPAATTNPMNGSVDMPFIANDAGGTFEGSAFCIQSVETVLNNNLTPQTCIGEAAPNDYSEGVAQIAVSLNAYLEDSDWNLIAKKIDQTPFAIGYIVKNSGGFYGVFMPAVQVSFEDPASAGQNQDVFINASGTAKIGANGEKSLRIYRG